MKRFEMKETIWSDEYVDEERLRNWYEEDYKECYELEDNAEISYDELVEFHYNILNDNLADLRFQLNVSGDYIIIAKLGLWDGVRYGYKEADSLNELLYVATDHLAVGFSSYDFVGREIHHDGTNYYLVREWKDTTTESQKEILMNKIYNNEEFWNDLGKYTKSVMHLVAESLCR